MAIVVNDRERIGEEKLGVLFDGGKVRRRREWRGLRDTLYDYGRWLYILSILAKVTAKPRNVKAMFRYRWFANYLAVPHMLDKFTMGLRDEPLRIVHTAMDFVVKDVAMTIDNSIRGDRRTGNDVEFFRQMRPERRERHDRVHDGLPHFEGNSARNTHNVLCKPPESVFHYPLSRRRTAVRHPRRRVPHA